MIKPAMVPQTVTGAVRTLVWYIITQVFTVLHASSVLEAPQLGFRSPPASRGRCRTMPMTQERCFPEDSGKSHNPSVTEPLLSSMFGWLLSKDGRFFFILCPPCAPLPRHPSGATAIDDARRGAGLWRKLLTSIKHLNRLMSSPASSSSSHLPHPHV